MDEEHTWRCDLAADDDVRQSHAGSNLPGVPRPLLLTDNGDQWTHLSVLRRSSGGRRLTSETGQGWVRARWKLNLWICFTNGTFDQDPFIYILYIYIYFFCVFVYTLRLVSLKDCEVYFVYSTRGCLGSEVNGRILCACFVSSTVCTETQVKSSTEGCTCFYVYKTVFTPCLLLPVNAWKCFYDFFL